MSDIEVEKMVKQIKLQFKIIGWAAYGMAILFVIVMFMSVHGWWAIPALFFCWIGHSAFHNLGETK